MTKIGKLIEEMNKKPTPSNVSFEDFKKYLEHFGFVLVRTNGSHNIFEHIKTNESFSIPTKNGKTVKPNYIAMMNRKIEEMED